MYDALSEGDYETLQQTATSKTVSLLMMGAMLQCTSVDITGNRDKEEMASECLHEVFGGIVIEDIEVKNETQDNANVVVSYINNGQAAKEELHLIKEDEGWKVSLL